MSAKPSVTRSASSAMSAGVRPLITVPAPQAVPIAAADTGASPQTVQHPRPAVVEHPLRQVGEFDADHVAEDGELDEGGDRRGGGDDDAGHHQRPSGGEPRLAGAGGGAEPRHEVREGRHARREAERQRQHVEAVQPGDRKRVPGKDADRAVGGIGLRDARSRR